MFPESLDLFSEELSPPTCLGVGVFIVGDSISEYRFYKS